MEKMFEDMGSARQVMYYEEGSIATIQDMKNVIHKNSYFVYPSRNAVKSSVGKY